VDVDGLKKEESESAADLEEVDKIGESLKDFGAVRQSCYDPDEWGVNFIGCR
jgi:hypothetical protein